MLGRLFTIVALGLLIGGCAKTPNTKPKDLKGDPHPLPASVSATLVTVTEYEEPPGQDPYYTVTFPQAKVLIGNDQLQKGVSGNVTGTIYSHGVVTARFTSDSAVGQKSSPKAESLDVLILQGHVVIHSLKPAADLYCDQFQLEMKTHLYKARGNVHINTADGLMGTLPEAWATQDFSKIASPELFNKTL